MFYHFVTRVLPGLGKPWSHLDLSKILPYVVVGLATVMLWRHKKFKDSEYSEFLSNSPGKEIDTLDIKYGIGHPSHEARVK